MLREVLGYDRSQMSSYRDLLLSTIGSIATVGVVASLGADRNSFDFKLGLACAAIVVFCILFSGSRKTVVVTIASFIAIQSSVAFALRGDGRLLLVALVAAVGGLAALRYGRSGQ